MSIKWRSRSSSLCTSASPAIPKSGASGEMQSDVELNLSVVMSQCPPNLLIKSKIVSYPSPVAQKSLIPAANPDNFCCSSVV